MRARKGAAAVNAVRAETPTRGTAPLVRYVQADFASLRQVEIAFLEEAKARMLAKAS